VTDLQLVEQTLAGSESAFRTLVVRYERRVYNLLARMLRNPALAEELAQETFLKAFTHLRSFDPGYKFSNWLLKIAHNAAIDAMRRRGPQEVPLDEPGPRDEARRDTWLVDPNSGAAAESVERDDLGRLLRAAMDRLRPEYRKVVVLRYQEELSYEDVAEVTGLPIGTIKSHLHRARAEMAEFLSRRGLRAGRPGAGAAPQERPGRPERAPRPPAGRVEGCNPRRPACVGTGERRLA
jgi:RNA polymerase sigma-70 factor (ECF subfamily)